MANEALITQPAQLLPSADTFGTMLQMADTLYKSGLLPAHIKTMQAAFAIIQKGIELRIPPMYALSNIIVVKGKPSANAELMLALVHRDHGDDAMRFIETTAGRATLEYKRRGWKQPERYSFTMEMAKNANLLTNEPWKLYPDAMLRARCISAVARMAFPGTIGGMHTPEELGVDVEMSDDGEMVVTVLDAPARTAAAASEVAGHRALSPAPEPEVEMASDEQITILIKRLRFLGKPDPDKDIIARMTRQNAQEQLDSLAQEWAKQREERQAEEAALQQKYPDWRGQPAVAGSDGGDASIPPL